MITSMRARPMNAAVHSADSSVSIRWGRLRFVIGMSQMAHWPLLRWCCYSRPE